MRAEEAPDGLAGGGEMGARMRAIDWSNSELGSTEKWPESLKTCVRIVLTSAQPMFVWWGDKLINLYNDASRSIVGGKHPGALGRPAAVVWQEIWDQVGPRAASAMRNKQGSYDEALLLIMERDGQLEEAYYTFSYSPVPNDHGGTGGLICAATDDTQRIVGARQLSLLRELGASTAHARSAGEACLRATRALAANRRDLTFAVIYLCDHERQTFTRAAVMGIPALHPAAPERISAPDDAPFPVFEALAKHALLVSDARAVGPLPCGAWQRGSREVATVPLFSAGQSGVLIVGLNPFRQFDADYRGFVELVAGQLACAIAGAGAYQQEQHRAEELATRDRAKSALHSNISHPPTVGTDLMTRERQRPHEVLMQAPLPLAVLTGPELRFEVANPAFCRLLGKEDLAGSTAREVFAEPDEQPILAGLEQVLRTGQPVDATELQLSVPRDGQRYDLFFNYAARPLAGRDGEPSGVIAVVSDVSEQVQARRKLDALRDAAERASRAKDEFLSTLSHELRTPLSAMIGWSSLLQKGAVPPDRFDKALETIERNAKLQARLIEDMLDLSRIEQGKMMLRVGPLELARVVSAAIDALRPAAEAKGVHIEPLLNSLTTIVGDADRLQQVMWNLLSNAVKFTPKGGRVQVRLSRRHSHVQLAVADTGQGIEADFLPYVFDRFRQADPSYAPRAGGLGLGLAIVRSLVELHGGTVRAESAGRDQGALFFVHLPIAPPAADGVPASGPRAPRDLDGSPFEVPAELRGLTMLVVDDEPETLDLLKFVLEQCEVTVTIAESAREALSWLEQQRFDVLISDIGMPEIDGYALIKQVRQLPREQGGALPALALIASPRAEDRGELLRVGFNMHLAKPIDPSELLVVLTTLVNGYLRRR